jgi:hypothetical protein
MTFDLQQNDPKKPTTQHNRTHHQKFCLFLFLRKKIRSLQQPHAKDYQSSQGRNARQDQQAQRQKQTRDDYTWTLQSFHSSGFPTYIRAKEKTKMTQTTTTIPPPHHQVSHRQLMKGRMTPTSLRPDALGSRGHPPNPLLGPCCTRIQAAPAQSLSSRSAIGRQPMPTGYPSRPCLWL